MDRIAASGIHLGLSIAVAVAAAWLVFEVWYPYPYREISGGRALFFIVIAVDVIIGPLLTLVVFNRAKPVNELRRDLAVIGLLQVAALVYGLWAMSAARPVHLVFEIDRFRVIHAVDVPRELMDKAPPELQLLPLWGPTLLSVRDFKTPQEGMEATMVALQGLSLGARPDFWQSYEKGKLAVLRTARPLAELKTRFPDSATQIDAVVKAAQPSAQFALLGYVPMVARNTFWTVLVHMETAEVITFVSIDSF